MNVYKVGFGSFLFFLVLHGSMVSNAYASPPFSPPPVLGGSGGGGDVSDNGWPAGFLQCLVDLCAAAEAQGEATGRAQNSCQTDHIWGAVYYICFSGYVEPWLQ